MGDINKNIECSKLCPFCGSNTEQVGVSILTCKKCDSSYYVVKSNNLTIESFNTKKYAVQMYKSQTGVLTRVNIVDDRRVLFWLKEEIKYHNSDLNKLDSKIDSLVALS